MTSGFDQATLIGLEIASVQRHLHHLTELLSDLTREQLAYRNRYRRHGNRIEVATKHDYFKCDEINFVISNMLTCAFCADMALAEPVTAMAGTSTTPASATVITDRAHTFRLTFLSCFIALPRWWPTHHMTLTLTRPSCKDPLKRH